MISPNRAERRRTHSPSACVKRCQWLLLLTCSLWLWHANSAAETKKTREVGQKPHSTLKPILNQFGAISYNSWFDVFLFYDSHRSGIAWNFWKEGRLSAEFLQEGEAYFQETVEIERDTEIKRFVDTLYLGGALSLSSRLFKSPWWFSISDTTLHENATDNRYDNAHQTLSVGLRHFSSRELREIGSEYSWHFRRYIAFDRLDLDAHTASLHYQESFGWDPFLGRFTILGSYKKFPSFVVRDSAGLDSGERRRDFTTGGSVNTWWLLGKDWSATFDYHYERNFSNGDEFDGVENIFLHDFYNHEIHVVKSALSKKLGRHQIRWSHEYEQRRFPSRPARDPNGVSKREDRQDHNAKTALEIILQALSWWQFNLNYTFKVETSTDQNRSFKRNFATHIGTIASTIQF